MKLTYKTLFHTTTVLSFLSLPVLAMDKDGTGDISHSVSAKSPVDPLGRPAAAAAAPQSVAPVVTDVPDSSHPAAGAAAAASASGPITEDESIEDLERGIKELEELNSVVGNYERVTKGRRSLKEKVEKRLAAEKSAAIAAQSAATSAQKRAIAAKSAAEAAAADKAAQRANAEAEKAAGKAKRLEDLLEKIESQPNCVIA